MRRTTTMQEHFNGEVSRVTDVVVAHVGSIARGIDHSAMFPETLADPTAHRVEWRQIVVWEVAQH
jgi:hypothetical protein